MQATVGRWGNSLAVRLPSSIVDAFNIRDGESVDIVELNGEVVIRKVEAPIDLAGLFRGRSAAAWRAEYAGSDVWGPDVGREIVPE